MRARIIEFCATDLSYREVARFTKMVVESAEKGEFHIIKWKIESALNKIIDDVKLTQRLTRAEAQLVIKILGEGQEANFSLRPLEDHMKKEFRKLQKSSKAKRPSLKRPAKSKTKP